MNSNGLCSSPRSSRPLRASRELPAIRHTDPTAARVVASRYGELGKIGEIEFTRRSRRSRSSQRTTTVNFFIGKVRNISMNSHGVCSSPRAPRPLRAPRELPAIPHTDPTAARGGPAVRCCSGIASSAFDSCVCRRPSQSATTSHTALIGAATNAIELTASPAADIAA